MITPLTFEVVAFEVIAFYPPPPPAAPDAAESRGEGDGDGSSGGAEPVAGAPDMDG